MIELTEDEIEEARNKVADSGKTFSGMTYEQGIRDALDWVLGNADNPADDY